jgi:peptide/nickel transport system permease protein
MQDNEAQISDLNSTLAKASAQMSFIAKTRRVASRLPILSGIIIFVLVFAALFADVISPHSPTSADLRDRRTSPAWYADGTTEFLLGADVQGRDILSRIIHGARVSLILASISISLGMIFGTAFGLVSGYFGGLWDEILMRIVDIFLAVPGIMLALVIILVFGQSFVTIIGVLTMFSWVFFARQLRAEAHQLKVLDYVSFAKVAGASTPRILIRHIFPGIVSTMTVIATLNVGNIILTESILSYLGAGIPPPTPAWGAMVSDGRSYLASSWWIAFFPGVAIFLTVLAFNFLGDWLRDTLDPRLRQVEQGRG